VLRRLRPFLARLARGVPTPAKARWRHLGDRLLPQYLPRRGADAGSGLLDSKRHHLAQDQSDAKLSPPALHQRPRDADLGHARCQVARHLQLRGDEGAKRRPANAFRLAVSDLLGPRAVEGWWRTQGPPDAKTGGAAHSRVAGLEPSR